ncbi:MAG: hypothetical protein V7K25_18785 [Nostoc sp.]
MENWSTLSCSKQIQASHIFFGVCASLVSVVGKDSTPDRLVVV